MKIPFVLLLLLAVCGSCTAVVNPRHPLGQVANAVANAQLNNVLVPAARFWQGPLPDYGRFEPSDAISMQIVVSTLLLAIAFRRIHRTTERQAVLAGTMAEHLLRSVLPRPQDVLLSSQMMMDAMQGLHTFERGDLLRYLRAAHLPPGSFTEVANYLMDYIDNGLGMTQAFPAFLHVYNPWDPHPEPNLAHDPDTDDPDDGNDDDGTADDGNDENRQAGNVL